MNNFFRPALSQLLELKLGDCTIEKRLSPLVTFLDRHRYALQKYIYPDCYSKVMEYLWGYILQVSMHGILYTSKCTWDSALVRGGSCRTWKRKQSNFEQARNL